MQPRRVGLELEGFAYEGNTPAVISLELIEMTNDVLRSRNVAGKITTDAGAGHIELVTDPLHDGETIQNTLFALRNALPSDWTVYFVNRRPGIGVRPTPWISLPRLNTLQAALKKKMPDHWEKVLHMSDFSSLHVTLEVAPDSPEGVLLVNYINLVAPWIARELSNRFSVSNKGHMDAWIGWTNSRYLPDPTRWFADPESMKSFFESLKCLVSETAGATRKVDDGWVVDLETRKRFGNKADEGTLWWFARPRKSYAIEGSPGAVEIRIAPSMDPHLATRAALLIRDIAEMLISSCDGSNFETPEAAQLVFSELAFFFPFLPVKPPNAAEWFAEIESQR